MNIIQSPDLPKPGGHYSQCIQHNGLLYISGQQLPCDPDTKEVPETIEAQTELVLKYMDTILKGSGADRDDVIQCRIYITDVAYWVIVNQIYATFFGSHKPVRATVPVPALHYGCKIEIEAIAAIKKV
ncbi:MAG: enamine deaminase RidA [Azospira oryzae]|jgi:2-iminobutanoate/2-iminopropanoate deaminase|nr:MAG: enamine deaminase RidA [Azospira oryzae]